VAQELRLGTRGSQLALWQAGTVASRIADGGGPPCRIVIIKTSGDRLQEAPLSEIGGKRLFVKEIEDALLRGEIDLAVHSSKDMPALLPDGLAIGAVLPREDPRDAVVLPQHLLLKAEVPSAPAQGAGRASAAEREADLGPASGGTGDDVDRLLATLGPSPAIGTGSVRRIAQLTRLFSGARFMPIRGNLDTRLRKLDNGEHDALILAAAGLRRLGFASRISLALPPAACLPAPGQGIVAIEIRVGDERVRQVLATVDDPLAAAALRAERAVVVALGGGCQTPIGALASAVGEDEIELVAAVVSLDGSREIRRHARATRDDASALGTRVGAQLLEDGAGEILADAHARSSAATSPRSSDD
jgi:hydroxymethylbilane synthase